MLRNLFGFHFDLASFLDSDAKTPRRKEENPIDEKLYAALGHDSLEQYAQDRLGLARDSLDRYLKIFQ